MTPTLERGDIAHVRRGDAFRRVRRERLRASLNDERSVGERSRGVEYRAVRMLDARARLRAKRRVGARDDHRDDDRVVVAMDGRHRHFGRATSTREYDGRPRRRGRDDDAERARPADDDGVSPNRRRARLNGYHRERTHGSGAREDVRIIVDVVVIDTFSSSASKHRRHGDAAPGRDERKSTIRRTRRKREREREGDAREGHRA